MKYINKTGLTKLVQNVKNYVTQVIQKEYNHVVTAKANIITDKRGSTLSEYTIQCLLNNSSVSVMSLSDISVTEYSNTRKAVWNKSENQTGLYADILSACSTAGRGVLKLTIENTKKNSTESHYICFIEDTPSQGVFLFSTTCEWDIEVRQETKVIHAYLKIPDDFAGTITLQGVRCNLRSGSQWYVTQPKTDGSPKVIFNMLADPNKYFCTDGNTYEMEFYTSPYGSPLSSNSFITPFGKYKTDIIFDFGILNLKDKIQDSVINDALVHGLNKRLSTLKDKLNEFESNYNPLQFAPVGHTHSFQDIQNLEQTLNNFSDRIGDVELETKSGYPIDIEESACSMITPNGEFDLLISIMEELTNSGEDDSSAAYYQQFNRKILLPRFLTFTPQDPETGAYHCIRTLPWTIYLYNRITVQDFLPTAAEPVLYIAFGTDTIRLLRELGWNDAQDIQEDILGLTYDRASNSLVFTTEPLLA